MTTLNAHTFASRDDAEKHYLALIDSAAATARYIDPALAEVYREKLAEAKAGGGPRLIAEAAALGIDAETVLNGVLKNHEQRQQHIHRIELARITAKAAVRNAANAAAMHRIYREYQEAL
ncbi:hypothetical protein [Vreelandella aquamarina]|uniref:Uncharacterized protein n=1 Tax=Vreelandella aquamarina TaxID=77097 RepID=A0A857GL77_9GAMM|nr:hypothetical protein [Halomonas meridiana]QHD50068.1 hypothetical protein CTT34_10390 [Halomonas meridiana]